MNIPAIETGVLPPPDSYLDRDNNIPPEDGDQPPPPPPAEVDPIWRDQGAFGHLMNTLDLVLELNLLNNLLSRDRDSLAGFGSRDSGQIMSMVMILLLIV